MHADGQLPASPPRARRIFLSHNGRSRRWVSQVAEQWRRLGLKVFFDEDSINPGEDVISALENGITWCDHVVLVLTPAAVQSRWVAMEIAMARYADPDARDRRLIPLLVEPMDPATLRPALRSLKMVDLTDPALREERYHRLLRSLGLDAPALPAPPDLDEGSAAVPLRDGTGAPGGGAGQDARTSTATGRVGLELTIEGELDQFTPDAQQKLFAAIKALLETTSELRIRNIRPGSIILTLDLTPEEAERLFWAVERGALDALGVRGARKLDPDHDAAPRPFDAPSDPWIPERPRSRPVQRAADLFARTRRAWALRTLMAEGLYPYLPIQASLGTEVVIGGERRIMLGSDDYLGLTRHPLVQERAREALYRYGSGCTGSRFLNGTLDLHEQLEHRLAAFMGSESALVFSTGYQAALGVISALVTRGAVVIQDRGNDPALVDAAMLAMGELTRYAHKSMGQLRQKLEQFAGANGLLVATDGVFTTDGDLADLPGVLKQAKAYGARVLVNDGHGVGVLGGTGRGTAEHFGVLDQVDLTLVSFSKSFAAIGGAVTGPGDVIQYLRHHARTLIFSASMPPSAVATVLACLDVMQAEPERRQRLWENADYLRGGLVSLGFDTGESESPIIPVVTGSAEKTLRFWLELLDAGVVTSPPFPSTDAGRLRTRAMATHTRDQLDRVLDAFARAGRALDIR